MPSWPLGSTHGRMTLVVACHHRPLAALTVRRRQAWHAIIAMGNTRGRMTSGVTCHLRPWTTHTVGRRLVFHASIVIGQCTRLEDVERGIPSWPLDNTHNRTTSGVDGHHRPRVAYPWSSEACHHSLWTIHCRKMSAMVYYHVPLIA